MKSTDVYAVGVEFIKNGPLYTYKSKKYYPPEEFVVVPTKDTYEVARIKKIKTNYHFKSEINYKWLVGSVNELKELNED
jgi:hypothetical protein